MKRLLSAPVLLAISCLCTFCIVGVSEANKKPQQLEAMQLEEVELVGDGLIASYVAKLPNNTHCAEVSLGNKRYSCIVPAGAKAGERVRIHKISMEWGCPIFFAKYPPTPEKDREE